MIVEIISGGIVYHYSDAGKKIKQIETGYMFDNAADIATGRYTYEETDVPAGIDEAPTVEDYENALAELGVK